MGDNVEDPLRIIYDYTTGIPVPHHVVSPFCTHCSVKFSMLISVNRQKHCGLCGLSFCGNCTVKLSLQKEYEAKGKSGPQRVCFGCRDLCLVTKYAALDAATAALPVRHAVLHADAIGVSTTIDPQTGMTRQQSIASGGPPSMIRQQSMPVGAPQTAAMRQSMALQSAAIRQSMAVQSATTLRQSVATTPAATAARGTVAQPAARGTVAQAAPRGTVAQAAPRGTVAQSSSSGSISHAPSMSRAPSMMRQQSMAAGMGTGSGTVAATGAGGTFDGVEIYPPAMWEDEADFVECHKCHKKGVKPYNCRVDGLLYCDQCTSKMTIPLCFERKKKFGPARVCAECRFKIMAGAKLMDHHAAPEEDLASAASMCVDQPCAGTRISQNGLCARHVNELGSAGAELTSNIALSMRWEGEQAILGQVAIEAPDMNLAAIDAVFRRWAVSFSTGGGSSMDDRALDFNTRADFDYVFGGEAISPIFFDVFTARSFAQAGNAVFIRRKVADAGKIVGAYGLPTAESTRMSLRGATITSSRAGTIVRSTSSVCVSGSVSGRIARGMVTVTGSVCGPAPAGSVCGSVCGSVSERRMTILAKNATFKQKDAEVMEELHKEAVLEEVKIKSEETKDLARTASFRRPTAASSRAAAPKRSPPPPPPKAAGASASVGSASSSSSSTGTNDEYRKRAKLYFGLQLTSDAA